MAIAIARRFLVNPAALPALPKGLSIQEGFLSRDPWIRIRATDEGGLLTVKGGGTLLRSEYSYDIPRQDAFEMLQRCWGVLEKRRFEVPYGDRPWVVEQFFGGLEGLWVGEIALASPTQLFREPPWVVREVTGDARYSMPNLVTLSMLPPSFGV
jgi:adenylate cyclase